MKWKNRGFWHASWISDERLKGLALAKHRNFVRGQGANPPPKAALNRPALLNEVMCKPQFDRNVA